MVKYRLTGGRITRLRPECGHTKCAAQLPRRQNEGTRRRRRAIPTSAKRRPGRSHVLPTLRPRTRKGTYHSSHFTCIKSRGDRGYMS